MALAVVQSLLVFCGAVALLTEALSPFHLLRRGPLLLCWLLILVAAVRFRPRPALPARPQLFDALVLAGIGAVALVIGLIAVVSPPNSADALAYHLPRVVYWAQSGSVAFFPTHYYNQVMLPPLAEYIMLHTYILSGGDRYVNLVQFLGFLGSLAAVSLVARFLGAGRRGQIIAALFCATLPNGILQASGAKNDYLLAFFLAAMVYFALERRPLWLGLSLSLALLTKATAWLFAPALLAGVFTPSLLRGRRSSRSAYPCSMAPTTGATSHSAALRSATTPPKATGSSAGATSPWVFALPCRIFSATSRVSSVRAAKLGTRPSTRR